MGVTFQQKIIRCLAGSQTTWGEFREGGVPCSQECFFEEREDATTRKLNWYERLHMVRTHLQDGKFEGRPTLGSNSLVGLIFLTFKTPFTVLQIRQMNMSTQ